MKYGINLHAGRIETDCVKEGKSIEEQMRKALHDNEPIPTGGDRLYSERKEGVLPHFDIRTDRFELARLATDKVHASSEAQRRGQDFGVDKDGNPIINKDGSPVIGSDGKPLAPYQPGAEA